jgi:hypothetical protein
LHLYHSARTFSLLSHSYLLARTRSHEALSTRTWGLHFVSLKPCQDGQGALTGWQSQHPAWQQNPDTTTRWRPRSLVGPCQRKHAPNDLAASPASLCPLSSILPRVVAITHPRLGLAHAVVSLACPFVARPHCRLCASRHRHSGLSIF